MSTRDIFKSLNHVTIQILVESIFLFVCYLVYKDDSFYGWSVSMIPKIAFALIIPLLDSVYKKVAVWLNDKENYRLEETYENHLIIKISVFQFVNSFLSLFYIAFYLQDMDKLKDQLAALLITRQVVGNVKESLIPYLLETLRIAEMTTSPKRQAADSITEHNVRCYNKSWSNAKSKLKAVHAVQEGSHSFTSKGDSSTNTLPKPSKLSDVPLSDNSHACETDQDTVPLLDNSLESPTVASAIRGNLAAQDSVDRSDATSGSRDDAGITDDKDDSVVETSSSDGVLFETEDTNSDTELLIDPSVSQDGHKAEDLSPASSNTTLRDQSWTKDYPTDTSAVNSRTLDVIQEVGSDKHNASTSSRVSASTDRDAKQESVEEGPSQTEVEYAMDKYDGTFEDYLEMFIQFGYVVLFSSAFPLAALCALINNLIEIRSDAFKLCEIFQRPFGQPAENIGSWQDAMEIMGIIAVIVNCTLVGLNGQLARMFPSLSTTGVVIVILLIEHLLLLLKFAIAFAIPDVPHWVATELAKVEFQRREAEKTLLKQQYGHGPSRSGSSELTHKSTQTFVGKNNQIDHSVQVPEVTLQDCENIRNGSELRIETPDTQVRRRNRLFPSQSSVTDQQTPATTSLGRHVFEKGLNIINQTFHDRVL